MYRFKRILIWLYRWRHSRGFGVQSPNDYSFIRYVINEHWPYYSYNTLRCKFDRVSALKRKKAELYFRVANWLQPDLAVLMDEDNTYRAYIHAGCNKTRIFSGKPEDGSVDLLIARLTESNLPAIIMAFEKATDSTLFIIEDIYSGKNYELWEKLMEHDRIGITYDLYYVGLLFFDKTRYKQHYKINF